MITNRMFGGCPACGGPSDDDELLLPPNLHEASTSVAANSVPVVSILDCMAFPSFLFSAETMTRLLRQRVTLIAPPRDCRRLDRKSTRLNSSHVRISYAVFCLKKKTQNHILSLLTA